MASRETRPAHRSGGVISDGRVADEFGRGVRDLVNLLRPVYGVPSRYVATSGPSGGSAPELLHDGATIARRMTGLDDRLEDVGAMYLRGLLQQIHDLAGDGASTGALIFEAIFKEGRRAIAAGHHPARLRAALLRLLDPTLTLLSEQRHMPQGCHDLHRLALAVSGEVDLAAEIAAVAETLGPSGGVEVRSSAGAHFGHDLMDEPYWPAQPLERSHLQAAWGTRAEAVSCAVLVSDLELQDAADAIVLLDAARRQGAAGLLVLARSCALPCQQVFLANASPAFRVLMVSTPGTSEAERWENMTDLAIMSGARIYHRAAGASVASIGAGDLGCCRRVWVTRTHVGLVGGGGDGPVVRRHVASLRDRYRGAADVASRERFRKRLARLTGRGAVLWIAGASERETELRRQRAERGLRVVQRAMEEGVLPGGGVSLMRCASQLSTWSAPPEEAEEHMARAILRAGLLAPIAALAAGADLDPAVVLDRLARHGRAGLNCATGELVAVDDLPVLDAYEAVATAVRMAVSGAAQALTVDTVVFRKNGAMVAS